MKYFKYALVLGFGLTLMGCAESHTGHPNLPEGDFTVHHGTGMERHGQPQPNDWSCQASRVLPTGHTKEGVSVNTDKFSAEQNAIVECIGDDTSKTAEAKCQESLQCGQRNA